MRGEIFKGAPLRAGFMAWLKCSVSEDEGIHCSGLSSCTSSGAGVGVAVAVAVGGGVVATVRVAGRVAVGVAMGAAVGTRVRVGMGLAGTSLGAGDRAHAAANTHKRINTAREKGRLDIAIPPHLAWSLLNDTLRVAQRR